MACPCEFLAQLSARYVALVDDEPPRYAAVESLSAQTLGGEPLFLDDFLVSRLFPECPYSAETSYGELLSSLEHTCNRLGQIEEYEPTTNLLPVEVWREVSLRLDLADMSNLVATNREIRSALRMHYLSTAFDAKCPDRLFLLSRKAASSRTRFLSGFQCQLGSETAFREPELGNQMLQIMQSSFENGQYWLQKNDFRDGKEEFDFDFQNPSRGGRDGSVTGLSADGKTILNLNGSKMHLLTPLEYLGGGEGVNVGFSNNLVTIWKNGDSEATSIPLNASLRIQSCAVRKELCVVSAGTRMLLINLNSYSIVGDDEPLPPVSEEPQKPQNSIPPSFKSENFIPVDEPDEQDENDDFLEIYSSVSLSSDLKQVSSLRFVSNSALASSELQLVDIETQAASTIETNSKLIIAQFAAQPFDFVRISAQAQFEKFDFRVSLREPVQSVFLPGCGGLVNYACLDVLDQTAIVGISSSLFALDVRKFSHPLHKTRIGGGVRSVCLSLNQELAVVTGGNRLIKFSK